jgi:16S rRNA (cytosine1402-N4)-methyltransferase
VVQYHQPVMVQEVVQLLQPRPGDTIVDCNVGTGGHSLALLKACGGKGFLVGLDLDGAMLSLALERFRSCGISSRSYALVHANHADLAQVLGDLGLERADRIVSDLGASSLHYDDPTRGFSCQADGVLDMRYDREHTDLTAADIVNTWEEKDLAALFREEGDELWAARIARRLVARRRARAFERTGDLARETAAAIPRKAWPPRIHPATRVFLALRAAVNAEGESLARCLDASLEAVAPGGRVATLTFQSHEDGAVKRRFREACRDVIDETDPWGRVRKPAAFRDLTRRPLKPTQEEIEDNPRSRSAKLRGVEKLDSGSPPN